MVGPPVPELKIAVTVVFALIVNAHVPVPLQPPPLHPAKLLPIAGVAERVTMVPGASVSRQVLPQFRAPPDRVTVPLPVPTLAMDKTPWGIAVNVAITFFDAFIVTAQAPVPEQSPDHPVNA